MRIDLTPGQEDRQREFRDFADREVEPRAERHDRTGEFSPELVRSLAAAGYLGMAAPASPGAPAPDPMAFGLLCQELGRCCASTHSLVTVHGMALSALLRWGTPAQRDDWGARLAAGDAVIAFALSEPGAGSDAASLTTAAVRTDDGYELSGVKKWISFGQVADVFLLFARLDDAITAFLVERDAPGLEIVPITGLSGCRGAMLAELRLDACRVPAAGLVGRPGTGWQYVAATALDTGRYSVAWGCVGLAQACLDGSVHRAGDREQFGRPLAEHPLIQAMIADMVAGVDAARLLCYRAGWLRSTGDPEAVMATSIAKYFASRTANRVASDAVQIHGAEGFIDASPVQRHWRDAKIMEVIEGSTQIQQMVIARAAVRAGPVPAAGAAGAAGAPA
jgi:glutaryl-CoA dehydrogenase (non-decarboxylating)